MKTTTCAATAMISAMDSAGAPDLHKRVLDQGIEFIAACRPDKFCRLLRAEVARFAKLARDAGIKAD